MNDKQTIITCPNCSARNRVVLDRRDEGPRCGKCGAALSIPVTDRPVTITDFTFSQEVLDSPLPVLVDCWAPWCGPCKMIGPVLEELARTYQGRLKIAKLNVDENPHTATTYAIRSIPTLMFAKNGKIVDTQVGALSKSALTQRIEHLISL